MKTNKGRSPPLPILGATDTDERLCTTAHIGQIIQIIFNTYLKQKIMKTSVINSTKENGKHNPATLNGKTEHKGEQPKVNRSPLGKVFCETKSETGPKKIDSPVKPVQTEKTETTKTEAAQPKTAPVQTATKGQSHKPVLNLESTLKLVEDLHRRKIQRDKLLSTIGTLEEFEVAQLDDAEETDTNHFQGCELAIRDDSRRDFSTKNPYIIQKVAEYINALCMDRLAEIEGEIFIPA